MALFLKDAIFCPKMIVELRPAKQKTPSCHIPGLRFQEGH